MQNKATGITGSIQVGPKSVDDPYSKCVLLMPSMLGEDETTMFLKGYKELENVFA